MTTIEQAIHALENNVGESRVEGALNILRSALAAPATAPEKTVQEKKKEELIGAWFAEKKSALEMLDDYVKFNGINP